MKRLGATTFFAIIVTILAAFTAYDYWSSQKKEEAKVAETKVVRLAKDDLSSLEIVGPKETLKLEKQAGHWQITKPFDESADQQVVFTYLDQMLSEKISQVVKDGDFDSLTYGLQPPQFLLTLTALSPASSAVSQQTVKVGTMKAYDGSLYGQIDDQKKVVLLSSSWDVLMTKPAKDFRDTKLYHGPVKVDFDRIEVKGAVASFEINRIKNNYELKGSTDPIYQPSVQAWLEQIKALRGIAFVENPKPGFKPETTITLSRQGSEPFSEPFVLEIARDRDHPKQFEVTSTDLPGRFSSRVLAGSSAASSILVKPDVFYNQKAPFEFSLKDVAQLKFHNAKTGRDLDTKIDPSHPDILLSKLAQLQAVRFLGPGQAVGEKKFPSRLSLLKSDGSLVFEMSWGDPVIEEATEDRPESRYLPVRTNLSKQIVGVPEKQIAALAAEPEPTPVPPRQPPEQKDAR